MAKKKNINEITVAIDGEDWSNALDTTFKKKNKEVTIPGFRKGKATKEIFIKKYGIESLFFDSADLVIDQAYSKALAESKLEPVVQPKVEIINIDKEKVEFKFTIITRPEVNVKTYKDLKVKKDKVKVTKEEIEHEISHILERYTDLVTKEGTVENGDIAIIDFEGFKDGVAFDGGKGENYELEIGSNTFIPGFEEQLIGMSSGEEKEIKVTFPEEYHSEELKGNDAVFKVKINEIKEKIKREFDKELFEDLAMEGVDSKETLEQKIKEDLESQKEMDAENKYIDELLEKVSKNVEVDIPEEMVEEEVHRLMHRYEEQLRMQGISLELYYQFTRTTEEDLKNQLEKEAYNHVLYRLMLEKISKLEKVEITDKEAEEEVQTLADKYNMKKEEFLNAFGGIEMIKYDLEMRKIIDLLKEYNK